jgi:hypothetical protein
LLTWLAALKLFHTGVPSENKPSEQEHSVIPSRIAARAVVIGSPAIKSPIPGVLDGKINVLLGPP